LPFSQVSEYCKLQIVLKDIAISEDMPLNRLKRNKSFALLDILIYKGIFIGEN
jgi:hypothetical protein